MDLAVQAGLQDIVTASYRLPIGLEHTLAASFPEPGGAERVRAMVEADIGIDRLGLGATREPDGSVCYRAPCAVVTGRRR